MGHGNVLIAKTGPTSPSAQWVSCCPFPPYVFVVIASSRGQYDQYSKMANTWLPLQGPKWLDFIGRYTNEHVQPSGMGLVRGVDQAGQIVRFFGCLGALWMGTQTTRTPVFSGKAYFGEVQAGKAT